VTKQPPAPGATETPPPANPPGNGNPPSAVDQIHGAINGILDGVLGK
jgi:hypothetical protein